MAEYVVDPSMRFADIIVPTIDTVRAHFLLELLVSNFKPVSLRPCVHVSTRDMCTGGGGGGGSIDR